MNDNPKGLPRLTRPMILSTYTRGAGKDKSDPCRIVYVLTSTDGEHIAEYDPFTTENDAERWNTELM